MPKLNVLQWLLMVANLFVYALFGWKFAIVIMLGLVSHEYSHLIYAKKMGMETGGFWLVPFIGGAAVVYSRYKTLWHKARFSLAGPIGGGIPAVIAIVLYWATGINWIATAAFWIAIFNGLNLLPVSPILDGGQILDAVSYSINKKMGLRLMTAMSLIGFGCSFIFSFPITGAIITAISFAILYQEYNRQQKETKLAREYCVDDIYLDRPFPMTNKRVWMTALIWLSTTLGLTVICVYVYSIGLSDIRLLLH